MIKVTPRKYLLYDARACGDAGTDDAACLGIADSLKEARRDARDLGYDCAIYSCAIDGNTLIDERWEEDYIT